MLPAITTPPDGAMPQVELADILRLYGNEYGHTHPVPPDHLKVLQAIQKCRTAALGGHREYCPACGFERFAYNSCRNRHCPKCGSLAKEQWLANRNAELLPVPYFHVVFTLPHDLNWLILGNKRPMLDLLFQAASQTLLAFGHNNLGGQLGFTMILHTWDQTLGAHFHLHGIVAAGALAPDASRWIDVGPKFLFPVRALSQVFRGKFLEGLQSLWSVKRLSVPQDGAWSNPQRAMGRLVDRLYKTPWVVYAKKPFAGPQPVLDYLGRYSHRVAISNHRLLNLGDGKVTFRYRKRRQGDALATMTLQAVEFIRRFLLHVLPDGFKRIRHFGFLANRVKGQSLRRCRELLGSPEPPPPGPKTAAEWLLLLTGTDITRCPTCNQTLVRVRLDPVARHTDSSSVAPQLLDSS